MVVLQIIWRGTSNRCHPGSATHPLIFQTHSKMKMQVCFPSLISSSHLLSLQTRHTFLDLIMEVRARVGKAFLMVVDNALSHYGGELTTPVTGDQTCPYLLQMVDVPDAYLFKGLKNKSHVCNPGDQFINAALRRAVRNAGKERMAEHTLAGNLPPLLPISTRS